MRPPMRQSVVVHRPKLDALGKPAYDKYGKPIVSKESSIARVRRKGNLVVNSSGEETRTNIEIDVPRKQMIESGNFIEFVDMDGVKGTGDVVSYEEATNLTGSRVLFRTVFVNGR